MICCKACQRPNLSYRRPPAVLQCRAHLDAARLTPGLRMCVQSQASAKEKSLRDSTRLAPAPITHGSVGLKPADACALVLGQRSSARWTPADAEKSWKRYLPRASLAAAAPAPVAAPSNCLGCEPLSLALVQARSAAGVPVRVRVRGRRRGTCTWGFQCSFRLRSRLDGSFRLLG